MVIFFYFAGESENSIPFSKLEIDHVFVIFSLLLDSGTCLPFNVRNNLNLKKKSKVKPRKNKFEPEQFS